MRVVSTVRFGWTAQSMAERWLANWVAAHPALWMGFRGLLWLVTHPLHTVGLALAVWLWAGGWHPAAALGLGALPLGAWRCRTYARVLLPPNVVRGKGFWAAIPARAWHWRQLRRHWREAATAAGITSKHAEGRVPPLRHVRATRNGLAANITPGTVGVTADQVAKAAETLAAVVPGCRSVTVTPGTTPGRANLHFMWSDPLADVVPLSRLPVPPDGRLSFGITEDGAPATIAKYKSALIVGQSGSGKSGTVWALIASLLADGTPFRLRIIDPAGGVELHALKGSPLVVDYASTPAEADKLISRMHGGMNKRLKEMSGNTRMHKPTEKHPWDILIIDELLLLDGVLKQGTKSPLGEILAVGRKAAYTVWALTQVPQLDALGRARSLFVQKLVLATDSRAMTDAVLGDGAESAGAKASKIRESTPGVGYAAIEGVKGYPRFRSVWVPDDMIHVMVQGHLPDQVPRRERFAEVPLDDQPHTMYAWYGEDGELLYIGISNRSSRRAMEHLRDKDWANVPGITMKVLETFDGRAEALAAEEAAIKSMRPKHNKVHNLAA